MQLARARINRSRVDRERQIAYNIDRQGEAVGPALLQPQIKLLQKNRQACPVPGGSLYLSLLCCAVITSMRIVRKIMIIS